MRISKPHLQLLALAACCSHSVGFAPSISKAAAAAGRQHHRQRQRQQQRLEAIGEATPASGDWWGGAGFGGEEVAVVKTQILQLSAITDRGQQANEAQRHDMELLVTRLQELVPLDEPFSNDDMLGAWTMAYSSAQTFRGDPVFSLVQALAGNPLWPNRVFRLAGLLPTGRVGAVQQVVEAAGGQDGKAMLKSRVEVKLFPWSKYLQGVIETEARIMNNDIGDGLEVIVERSAFAESPLRRLWPGPRDIPPLPVARISERVFDRLPRLALETLYLDPELRATRLPDETLLVYVKDPPPAMQVPTPVTVTTTITKPVGAGGAPGGAPGGAGGPPLGGSDE